MTFVFVLVGAAVTWMLADGWGFGWQATLVIVGGVIGWLFARNAALANRIQSLERQLVDIAIKTAASTPRASATTTPTPTVDLGHGVDATAEAPPSPPVAVEPAPDTPIDASTAAASTTAPSIAAPVTSQASDWHSRTETTPPEPRQPGIIERAFDAARNWLTVGNVPVKIGMLVLFFGVAALLKYAADAGWFTLPIEFRLIGIAVAALAGLVFGWRQRAKRSAFALSLQGGAIGLLMLTVFAAFRVYGVIPSGAAFALLLLIVAGSGVLAVRQHAMALAVLAMLGGYLAPVLISTGSGSHVALFGYYAVLNIAVFAIAWLRPWRVLNLIGFFFTYAIGTLWGVLSYRPEHFATTEPFLILFFVIYLLVPLLYARKREPTRRDVIDGTLVFGNPLVAFALQAALLHDDRITLAWSALAMAAIYAALAWRLLRRESMRLLGEAHAILAVGFATLAVPLALSAAATSCVFALEGAGLVWLALRQQRRLPLLTGIALQLLAGFAWWVGDHVGAGPPLLNGVAIGALLIGVAGWISGALLVGRSHRGIGVLATLWGTGWWLTGWAVEIDRVVPVDSQPDALLALVSVTAALMAFAWRRWNHAVHAWIAAAGLLLAMPLAVWQSFKHVQPFADWGLAAWIVFAAAGWQVLRALRNSPAAAIAQHGWLWSWTLALSLLLYTWADRTGLADGWRWAFALLPLLALAWAATFKPAITAWPLRADETTLRRGLPALIVIALLIGLVANLAARGATSPLPFVPLLNPLELVQIAMLLLIARTPLRDPSTGNTTHLPRLLIVGLGFLFVSIATLRGVHHLAGLPWDGVLAWTRVAQTSLTVVWSLLGMAAWIIGSKRNRRTLWLAGAALMGVVLLKLLLVDRQHLGNLYGIASFIAYGLLCTVIGYLAPAPAKALTTEESR